MTRTPAEEEKEDEGEEEEESQVGRLTLSLCHKLPCTGAATKQTTISEKAAKPPRNLCCLIGCARWGRDQLDEKESSEESCTLKF